MSEVEADHEFRAYKEPLMDGSLDVLLSAMYSGMHMNESATSIIWHIGEHEDRIVNSGDYEEGSERLAAAWHRLGQIAAIEALLELPEPRKVGF